MGYQAVRTKEWKCIHYIELEGMDKLYDLKADPYEMENLLISAPSQASVQSVRQQMKAELQQLLKESK